MEYKQRSGKDHVREYHEYPKVVYHPGGENRTITCKEQEEKGWYDSPTEARAVNDKRLQKESARAAKDKATMRENRVKERAAVAELAGTDQADDGEQQKQAVFEDLNIEELTFKAQDRGLEVIPIMTKEDIIAMIRADIAKREAEQQEDGAADQDGDEQSAPLPATAEEMAEWDDAPPPEYPSKSDVGKMNRAKLDELAGRLELTYPETAVNRTIMALINDKLGR